MDRDLQICVVGAGYVGLPLALEFSNAGFKVVAFDTDVQKVQSIQASGGLYVDGQFVDIKPFDVAFTTNPSDITDSNIYIVTVPTPVDSHNKPDLSSIYKATELIACCLHRGNAVIYESTVYPGATEDCCIPLLESVSGLKCGEDFYCGYSPERVNPGDKENVLSSIVKIVSGFDEDSLQFIDSLYCTIIKAGVYRAASIRVAEAAKVIENTQRDVNIALVNEFSKICHAIDLNTNDVLKAANSKWNFHSYNPGLVGGHCISVDPYYLINCASSHGLETPLISTARDVNNSMPRHIVDVLTARIRSHGLEVSNTKVGILGLTFKDNCSDTRNSLVFEIIKLLNKYSIDISIADPFVSTPEALPNLNARFVDLDGLADLDAIIVAVKHTCFAQLSPSSLLSMYRHSKPILFDLKSIYTPSLSKLGFDYLSL